MEEITVDQQQIQVNESNSEVSAPVPIDATKTVEQPATTSLVQSMLQAQADEAEDKKKKKKKKAKPAREREIVIISFISIKQI